MCFSTKSENFVSKFVILINILLHKHVYWFYNNLIINYIQNRLELIFVKKKRFKLRYYNLVFIHQLNYIVYFE